MTNEELLARIDLQEARWSDERTYKALRAVVTLCNFLDKKGRCCVPVQEIISAIEKELE